MRKSALKSFFSIYLIPKMFSELFISKIKYFFCLKKIILHYSILTKGAILICFLKNVE